MDRLQYILDRLPNFWYKEEQDSKIRAIVDAISQELSNVDNQIDYLNAMLGIDGTVGDDIDKRWGAMLQISRKEGENDQLYRNRIKTTISDSAGGTQHALKYSVGVALGIDNDDEINRRVQVIDAWLYEGTAQVTKEVGYVVIEVDLDNESYDSYSQSVGDTVQYSVDNTKASGVIIQLIFKNYKIYTYDELSNLSYQSLSTQQYNKLGVI